MLNKKFLTKIMNNDAYRHQFLLEHTRLINNVDLQIAKYAKYIVDYQILNRNKQFENDKTAYYGFSPIAPICFVANDGYVVTKMFEMNSINHFLIAKNGNYAVDVAICILVQLYNECKKDIRNFDVQTIDATLTHIEDEYRKTTIKDDNNEH